MTRKQQRLGLLALAMAALGGATVLVLSAFNDNLVFFYSPSELKAKAVAADRRVRIGLLPDLFREGQGAVAEGKLRPDGVFAASSVLAKHDENYMPREVVDALKKSGHWQEGGTAPAGMAQKK
jgi:cytochrome c-type biogenesis protein CcmE